MLRPAVAVVTVNILSSSIPRAFAICLLQTALTPPNFLPIISNNICANPPGTTATDGCDDVCLLTECCDNWEPNGTSVTLQNGNNVDCSTVNCGNVCRMACDRQNTTELCINPCKSLTSGGTAYVFSRNGFCNPKKPQFVDPVNPTHVGFGFKVASDVYVYGSVENRPGCISVLGGFDNGFWMTTGSSAQMLATFSNPSASGFHGAIFGGKVARYNKYKTSTVQTPNVYGAVKAAEDLYKAGYSALGNNCLDAVYNVLLMSGVTFPANVSPQTK
jgi:hypothetical protein